MAKAFSWGELCLSDIPKSKIRTAQNGKKYIGIKVMLRNTPEEKEKHIVEGFVSAVLGKDEKLPDGEREIFGNVGNWKDQVPSQVSAVPAAEPLPPSPAPTASASVDAADDLPF